MPSILFVCTANRFRSPLAAAMLHKNLKDAGLDAGWSISSAGTWAMTGEPAIPMVTLAAQRYQLDLSGHRSRRVDRNLLSQADLVVVMQSGHREALLGEFPFLREHVHLLSEITERRTYDIPDALATEQEMLDVIADLDALLRRGLESICVMATYLYNSRRGSNTKSEPGSSDEPG